MGAQQSSVNDVHVVVVGGGFGGITAAQHLKSQGLKFTLIDMRDAFHHNVAALRASVQPGIVDVCYNELQHHFLNRMSFIQSIDCHRLCSEDIYSIC